MNAKRAVPQRTMFPDGSDLPLFSGVPQTVQIKPFDADKAEDKQLGFFVCPLCRDTGTIKIHHAGLPGGMKEISCLDARHGIQPESVIERIADRILTPPAPQPEPEPPPAYAVERAEPPGERVVKPKPSRAKLDPELKSARERAAQYFAPVITTRIIAERDLLTLPQIHSPSNVADLLKPYFDGLDKEHMLVVMLNTKNRVLGVHVCYIGSVHTTVVRVGELFRPAILLNAPSIILAHNHPSGDPTPSPEDAAITREINKAGVLLDIDVLDHLVIGAQNKFVSLKERGLGF